MKRRLVFLFFLTFLISNIAAANVDTLSFVSIKKITVDGNKRTKDRIIFRELNFVVGDTISLSYLTERLEFNRLQLMNTGLFTDVTMNIREWDQYNQVSIDIQVVEAFYIYPIPLFELADRNFNVWWIDYNHSFRRINYGMRFYHYNLTGRRDVLKAKVQLGFTRKFELEYSLPFIDRRQQWGLKTDFLLTRNRDVNYRTEEDKQVFFRTEGNVVLRRLRLGATATLRPRLQTYHEWRLGYYQNQIEAIVNDQLNPDFFGNRLSQRYFSLRYIVTVDKRDIRPYPLNGYFFQLQARKDGLGLFDDLNAAYLITSYRQYFPFAKKWNLELSMKGQLGLIRQKQPFYNLKALGYEYDYIRGFEYYVIDGLDFAYLKTSLRFELFDGPFNWGKAMPLESFRVMPLRLYLTFNNDFGYANNPFYGQGNQLDNQLLWGHGVGLDVIVYYNQVFQLEVSRNDLGEVGFFLHWIIGL
jgi:outer membrane protein assembly factor BamA